MAKKRERDQELSEAESSPLRHVLVVGGTLDEWHALNDAQWTQLRHELCTIASGAGASWLTLRPYQRSANTNAHATSERGATTRTIEQHQGCTVIVDSCADGRDRLLLTIEQLRVAGPHHLDEAALGAALMTPAPCEPDLTVVLGPSTRLPPSLVWELSYCELVFIDATWDQLSGPHLEHAINEYALRHRRFGGIT